MQELAKQKLSKKKPHIAYDVKAVRADFPILSRQIGEAPLTYLDNGASAQKPKIVLDAIEEAYGQTYANVHRGLHTLSNISTDKFEQARGTVQRFLNAKHEEEIIFTRNATEAINLVASSFGLDQIGEGDEIIISIMEHHSNIVPWHFLRERKGAVIKWAPIDDDGNFLYSEFEKLISPRTKLIALTHMSNVLGTVVPVKKVIERAHADNIPVLIDGSQAAVHMPVDVQDLGADFYVMTGHKLYGPSGIGVLYGKYDLLAELPPYMGGGEMIDQVNVDKITYAAPPHRFEAGTPPIVQAIGLGVALDYMDELGRDAIAAHEADVSAYAHERIKQIGGLRLIGNAKGKGGILSFAFEGVHAHDISTILDRYGVAVRAGTHCAEPLMARFGVTSTCRASLGLYNNKADIDRFIEALEKAKLFFM